MYKFKITDDLKKFDDFVLKNNGSFFQSSLGAKMKKGWNPTYFIGIDKDNNIVLTALLLTRTIFKFIKIGYFHSGFVCDYNNKELLKEAIEYFKIETKNRHIAFTFIDPEITLCVDGKKDVDGEKKQSEWKDYNLLLPPVKEPFIQPKFTYILDLKDKDGKYKTIDEVISGFEKGVRYSVRTASSKGLKYEKYTYNDIKNNPSIIDEFMNVMEDTMDRLETTTRPKSYYQNVFEQFKDYLVLDMVYYDYDEDTKNYNQNLLVLKNKSDKEIESKVEAYNKRMEELKSYGIDIEKIKKLYLAAGVTIFYGNKTTCLYGGTRNVLRNATRSSHYLNYKRIENSINKKMAYHDFLRAHVYYRDKRDKNYGLSVFKKSFGANEIEYIGEYVMVNNYPIYFMFKTFYKRILKIILRIKRNKK